MAAVEFDETAVREALEAEPLEAIKARVVEINDERESRGHPKIPGAPKSRLIDAVVAEYRENGIPTEDALAPPQQEHLDAAGEVDDGSPEVAGSLVPSEDAKPGAARPGHALEPLGPPEAALPTQSEFASMRAMAAELCKTEFVPKDFQGRPEAVLACILTGRELGIGPMQALKDISIIDGRPALSASLMMALMRKGGVQVVESVSTDERASITARRSDTGETMTVEWTYADAEKITQKGKPLVNKDNWRNYRADMLWARCVGRLGRRLAPDILGGMGYSAEEMRDFDGAFDGGQAEQPKRELAWTPPADWKELHARMIVALGDVTDVSEAEAKEWTAQALAAKYQVSSVKNLDEAGRRSAWEALSKTLKRLEAIDEDLAFATGVREKVANAFAPEFGGLVGPHWRLGPDEPNVPTFYEVTGTPEPAKPEPEAVDGEWTPVDNLSDAERSERQAAWDVYVAAERVNHPDWNYPEDVPDDWEIGTEHIPF